MHLEGRVRIAADEIARDEGVVDLKTVAIAEIGQPLREDGRNGRLDGVKSVRKANLLELTEVAVVADVQR